MWGNKAKRIHELTKLLDESAEHNSFTNKQWEEAGKHCVSLSKTIASLTGEITALNEELVETREALQSSKDFNAVLHEENVDYVRKLDILQSVLRQLQVNIKLPAKKSDGRKTQ